MGLGKYKIEGGQGGKRGHSNMTHWEGTEHIKYKTKRKRRTQGKEICRDIFAAIPNENPSTTDSGGYHQ